MVMNICNSVNILKQDRFKQVIAKKKLREEVRLAYVTEDTREFDVLITTIDDQALESTFTAASIVQITNQQWVKSISARSVFRPCGGVGVF